MQVLFLVKLPNDSLFFICELKGLAYIPELCSGFRILESITLSLKKQNTHSNLHCNKTFPAYLQYIVANGSILRFEKDFISTHLATVTLPN